MPLVDNPHPPTENLGVGMYSSLMGTFDFPSPIARINGVSSSKESPRKEFFQTHYFLDPWTLPSPTTTLAKGQVNGMAFLCLQLSLDTSLSLTLQTTTLLLFLRRS